MVTLIRLWASGVITETPAVAPHDENRNNHHKLPKNNNKDNGGDDRKAAARDQGNNIFPFASFDNNDEVEMDNIDEHLCHYTKVEPFGTKRSSGQKRPLAPDVKDGDDDGKKKRRRKQVGKLIDLTGVEEQEPILRRQDASRSSKYVGATFDRLTNKWKAQIYIDGKQHFIGLYGNEEDAAKDHARAVFKYKGGAVGIERLKSQQRRKVQEKIDLTDVPEQKLIFRDVGKPSSSKYVGVVFNQTTKKWQAQIYIDGKNHFIGRYGNEEDAAKDYARAVFKYKAGKDDKSKSS